VGILLVFNQISQFQITFFLNNNGFIHFFLA